jgi:cytoskeletal protein CcmA (bactofilin family)
MERSAEIGSSIFIKGEITSHEDLVISGRLEGSVTVVGHMLTVNAGAEVIADLHAQAITVSGKVLGALSADARIELAPSAEVDGGISAPVLLVHDGATFQGTAETTREVGRPHLQLAS